MNAKRIIILKQGFDPEPTMKGLLFAKEIAKVGYDVEVVTGFPNYPGGRVYPGYKIRPISRQIMSGIPVTRLAIFPSHSSNKLGRVCNYASFFISVFIYMTFFVKKADVIYVYHPPLTVGLAAVSSQLIRKMPVVIDVQDLWPDTLEATGMVRGNRVLSLVNSLCNWTYRKVKHVVVQSPGFRTKLIRRGVPTEKVTVIPNWADEAAIGPSLSNLSSSSAANHFDHADEFRVLFAGNMGKAQALESVLQAALTVSKTNPMIRFYFLGSGLELESLKLYTDNHKISNVRFIPPVSMQEVGAYLDAADCLIVHLRNDPLFEITIPSKTQAYLAAGKPIIMAVAGDAAEIVNAADSGVVVPPEDPVALAGAVIKLSSLDEKNLSKLGESGQRYYHENLSMSTGIKTLLDVLDASATGEPV